MEPYYQNLTRVIKKQFEKNPIGDLPRSPMRNHRYRGSVSIIVNDRLDPQADYFFKIFESLKYTASSMVMEKFYEELDGLEYGVLDLCDTNLHTYKYNDVGLIELESVLYETLQRKKFCITNYSITTLIERINSYKGYVTTSEVKTDRVSAHGSLFDCRIMSDNKLSVKENAIYIVEDVFHDLELVNTLIEGEHLTFNFTYDISIANPEKFYIFTNDNDNNKDILNRYKRNLKLKDILNDEGFR